MEGEKETFREIVDGIGRGLDTHTVFGEPLQLDGSVIIPVAKIGYGGGGGLGGAQAQPGRDATTGPGEGMGMGFGVKAQPLGVVRVAHDTVEWIPTVDRDRLVWLWSIVGSFLLIMAVKRLFSR